MRPSHVASTPRQLIKCVYGLRAAKYTPTELTIIHNDSTLMDMDAPEVLPAGSTQRVEPLRDHPDYHDYFVIRESTALRVPLTDGFWG